ncbi:MAG: hypothetical protein Q8M70_00010 [bacterium]|nr:hypothetical protein [bacterium]
MKLQLKAFLLLASSILLLSVFIIGITFGWFAKAVVIPKGQISIGEITYVLEGELINANVIIVPGLELVTEPFTLTNLSSIDTQVRVKINYLAFVRNGLSVDTLELSYLGNSSDFISVNFGSNFSRIGNYWYYSADPEVDGFDYILPAESGSFSLFSSIMYDGTLTGIDFAGQNIHFTIIIEVKQARNVTWTELANINFQTGN